MNMTMNINNHTNRDRRNFQLFLLKHVVALKHEDTFLDYGCGPLRLGRELIPNLRRGNYFGVDIGPIAIRFAKDNIASWRLSDLDPCILQFDPETDPLISLLDEENFAADFDEQTFNVIWAFSVLIHMTDERLDSFLELVSYRLAANGRAYANVNLGEKWFDTEHWDGFPVVWRPIEELQERAAAVGLECVQLETLKHYGSALNDAADAQVMLLFTRTD